MPVKLRTKRFKTIAVACIQLEDLVTVLDTGEGLTKTSTIESG